MLEVHPYTFSYMSQLIPDSLVTPLSLSAQEIPKALGAPNICFYKSQLLFFIIQSLSHVRLFAVSGTAAHQACLSFTISQSLLKFMSIEVVVPSNHLILFNPLLLLPSIFPSIRVFPNVSALCIRWPEYWSFGFSISSSNEYSGLIFFRTDWFDLAVQGTLKSILQHLSLKASILCCSAFFMVQLSHLYMTTGKTIALTMDYGHEQITKEKEVTHK